VATARVRRDRLARRIRRLALVLYRWSPMGLRRFIIRVVSPTFTVGAVVVIRRADRAVLMVEQRHTGAWAFPGGLLEYGEDAAAAASREVHEEVGLRLDPAAFARPLAVLDPRRRSIDLLFFCDEPDGIRPRRNDPVEITGLGWFTPPQWPPLTEPTEYIVGQVDLT
jgi:8-oxo-dGTP pyrophosphatase MutT (NUDIX family)